MRASISRAAALEKRPLRVVRDGFATWRHRRLVDAYFDRAFYTTCYGAYFPEGSDPLDHYLHFGAKGRLDPHPDFSSADYAADHPELTDDGDVYFHYLMTRREQGPQVKPSSKKVEYFTASMFDRDYYLARYADVRDQGLDPLRHYMEHGWRERRDPSGSFSSAYYLSLYEDVRAADVNPLFHYVSQGAAEGRRPMSIPTACVGPNGAGQDETAASPLDNMFSRLAHRQPEFTSKCLRRKYLALGFGEFERARAFIHHYQFITRRIPAPELELILFHHLEVWRGEFEDVEHLIRLKFSTPSLTEGELSLEFVAQANVLYTLSFSFTPAALTGDGSGTQILISRLQGPKARWDEFKQASRRMKDVSAPYALMAALQGLAAVLEVNRLSGVPASRQSARGADHPADFEATYDRFFAALGVLESGPDGFFQSPLPLSEKPMSEVKRGHRIRTRVKREIKHQIAEAARLALDPTGGASRSEDRAAEAASTVRLAHEEPQMIVVHQDTAENATVPTSTNQHIRIYGPPAPEGVVMAAASAPIVPPQRQASVDARLLA